MNISTIVCLLLLLHFLLSSSCFPVSYKISTIAGGGTNLGDGGPAELASTNETTSVAINSLGEIIIATPTDNRIRKILTNGTITTLAGTGISGYNGDGLAAVSTMLHRPYQVFSFNDTIFFTDYFNYRLRAIGKDGIITTIAGNGSSPFGGDGQLAINSAIGSLMAVYIDPVGDLFFSTITSVQKLVNGVIKTLVGKTGVQGFSGDGGLASNALIGLVHCLTKNPSGELIIPDSQNSRIRKIDLNGTITTIVGNGTYGDWGEGVPALNASIGLPRGVIYSTRGDLYFADSYTHRIRKVSQNGLITTIAGNGTAGFSGDGGLAVNAQLRNPNSIVMTPGGEIYVADTSNNRIRKLTPECADGLIFISPDSCEFSCFGLTNLNQSVCSGRGVCIGKDLCICNNSSSGSQCESFNCFNISSTDQRVCSSKGICQSPNNCLCSGEYYGTDCSSYSCYGIEKSSESVCFGRGTCQSPNQCKCSSGWFGSKCEISFCPGSIDSSSGAYFCNQNSETNVDTVIASSLNSKTLTFQTVQTVKISFPSGIGNYLSLLGIQQNDTLQVVSSIDVSQNMSVVTGPIISLSLYNNSNKINVSNLIEPILFKIDDLTAQNKSQLNFTCMYFERDEQKWKSDGIETFINNIYQEGTVFKFSILCKSYHLSSFAVIDQNYKKVTTNKDSNELPKDNTTIIAIVVSVVGSFTLVVVLGILIFSFILIFICIRKRKKNNKLSE